MNEGTIEADVSNEVWPHMQVVIPIQIKLRKVAPNPTIGMIPIGNFGLGVSVFVRTRLRCSGGMYGSSESLIGLR